MSSRMALKHIQRMCLEENKHVCLEENKHGYIPLILLPAKTMALV